MQKITVKEVSGPLGKGERKFYAVVDDKGAEFTTFDSKIAQVTRGSVLEADVKVEGKYVNITEWKVLEEGKTGVPPVKGKPSFGKTPEQFEVERRSIESQTAFNGIIELIKVDKAPDGIRDLALKWATVKLMVTLPFKTPQARDIEGLWPEDKSLAKPSVPARTISTLEESTPVHTTGVKTEHVTSKIETPPPGTLETTPNQSPLIDLGWLRESLYELQWAGVGKYLKKRYNVTGKSISAMVGQLNPEQSKEFAEEVQRRLVLQEESG